jgi:hypothetical protein
MNQASSLGSCLYKYLLATLKKAYGTVSVLIRLERVGAGEKGQGD